MTIHKRKKIAIMYKTVNWRITKLLCRRLESTIYSRTVNLDAREREEQWKTATVRAPFKTVFCVCVLLGVANHK